MRRANIQIQNVINGLNTTHFQQSKVDSELTSVNSLNINKKIKSLSNILLDEKTTPIDIIKISNFICNKLHTTYRINSSLSKTITNTLYNTLLNNDDIPILHRLYYMRFRNEIIPYEVSLLLYKNNIKTHLEHTHYFQILKYILRSYLLSETDRNTIIQEFETLFTNPDINDFVKMEIGDIFLLNGLPTRGMEMINILRARERRQYSVKEIKTIYEDSQNVHNKDINKSVLKACINLILQESSTEFDSEEVIQNLSVLYPKYTTQIKKVIERINIETTFFSLDKDRFNIYILFSNIWSFINKHPNKTDLKARLVEEMVEMKDYCTTGHLSRLINVIQGYTNDEKICVRISNYDQLNSVINTYLNKILINAPENVQDAIIEDDQTDFINYVINNINKNLPRYRKEYGEDIDNDLINILEKYINVKNSLKIINNKIIL